MTRRSLLLSGFGWFPWFRPKRAKIAGIEFDILRHGRSPRRYLWIHGNETTARDVLRAHMTSHSGVAHLVRSDKRYVAILDGLIDPNRMFSRVGAEASLKRLNPAWPGEQVNAALDRLDRDRDRFVKRVLPPRGGLLVALHNNSEGYSVKDEVAISDQVSLKDPGHPHEFLLCTDAGDYDVLATSPFNVVLQHKAPPEDDGSLSRLAAKRGVRYVNIEVALGKRAEQERILQWVEEHLP